jgi:hypothetical protein
MNGHDILIDLNGEIEIPVLRAVCCSRIIGFNFIAEKSLTKHSTNFTTLQLIDKDTDVIISSINTSVADGVDITAFVPIMETFLHQLTNGGNKVLSFKKIDNGTSIDLGKSILAVMTSGFKMG